jgi:hypothetical protein
VAEFAEIEDALATMSVKDLEQLQLRVEGMLKRKQYIEKNGPDSWPIPPPNVSVEEIRRIQEEIDRAFSQVPHQDSRVEQIFAASQMTEEQADAMAEEMKADWWERNKERFLPKSVLEAE